jgi:MerR family transcriptional regulator, mercuric resistance operon regulatory protein
MVIMKLNNATQMTIGQIAKTLDLPISTLRYYEREGLLASPDRSGSGYRLYDEAAVERLAFIRSAQAVGFTLEDIRELLRLDGDSSCKDVQTLLNRRLAEVETKLADLKRVRTALSGALEQCRKSRRGCGVLMGLKHRKARRSSK